MRRFLPVVAALCALSVSAQTPERFSVEVSGGQLTSSTYIDGQNVSTDSDYRSSFLELGGAVNVLRRPGLTGSLGSFLRLTEVSYGNDFASGWGPQNLGLYAQVRNEVAAARLGFLLDVGNSFNSFNLDLGPVRSDQQDAFMLGLDAERTFNRAHVFGGFDAFLTTPDEASLTLTDEMGTDLGFADFDQGDMYALHAGAGYTIRRAEVGLRLQYTYTTEMSLDFGNVDPALFGMTNGTIAGSDRYQLSVIPYLQVRPGPTGLAFTLQGSAMGSGLLTQEYAPIGILIAGEATEAPRLPLSLRVQYAF